MSQPRDTILETTRFSGDNHHAAPSSLSTSMSLDAVEERARSPQASASSSSTPPPTSWISLSDVGSSFPSTLTSHPKLSPSASSSSLDMATYAPHVYGQHPESPSLSSFNGMNDMMMEERSRRFSVSSTSGVTLEDDIRSIGDQMKRVLAFCDLQSQNPIRLQAKINDLQEQLQLAVAEKNYWMKRCKEVSSSKSEYAPRETAEVKAADIRTSYVSCIRSLCCYAYPLTLCLMRSVD